MPRKVAATVSYQVQFGVASTKEPERGRVPRVARLLALAHRIDAMVRNGEFQDLAEAARAIGVTRARMTQIMNLLLLAPKIQEEILEMTVEAGRDLITERPLRSIVAEPNWTRQIVSWRDATSGHNGTPRFGSLP